MHEGLKTSNIHSLRQKYGYNSFDTEKINNRPFIIFLSKFKNPLVIILLCVVILSFIFGDKASAIIVMIIVVLSIMIDFISGYRSEKAAGALKNKVKVKAIVLRDGDEQKITTRELLPGDVVILSAGKLIPADGVIVESDSLCTNESTLTGESFPQTKAIDAEVYMGSAVVSGTGKMLVKSIGVNTKFSEIVVNLQSAHRVTEFEREINNFSMLIMKLTLVLVVFACFINIAFNHGLIESIMFSLALAVGLTPELLPLIITLNLSKGSLRMAKGGVIVKQLSAIQNLGSMDILCTDKTGTLTENKIELVKYVDAYNNISKTTLDFGYLVSKFTTGFENPLDEAILENKINVTDYEKVDEIPFDFERKCESVIVHHGKRGERTLITKGAPEEIFKISKYYQKVSQPIKSDLKKIIQTTYENLSEQGFRVIGVSTKRVNPEHRYTKGDENDMIFQGFLAFLDPAKKDIEHTLNYMKRLGISIKIITGDNLLVSKKIMNDINMPIDGTIIGDEFMKLSKSEMKEVAETTSIFARVNPEQKMKIVEILQDAGHVVGYMGDGINDAPTLRASDIGISVNNAVDVAKDAADFILLHKTLEELVNGVAEGRRTFANTMKYLRMTLSSNFGNMFSMAGSSLFLPFLPMKATQILLNNLLYDTSQLSIPLDNVDESEILKPHILNIKNLRCFMWVYGALSSVFDFITFGILLLIFHAGESVFQAGWFLESIITQVFVVYIIRTFNNPIKSRPSKILVGATLAVVFIAIFVLYTSIGHLFGFGVLTATQGLVLLGIVIIYLAFAQIIKRRVW